MRSASARTAASPTLKGLEGKTISATSGEAGLNIFPAILSHNDMPPDAIHFLRVDAEAKLVAYLQNRVPAVLCGAENQALILEDKGVPTLVLSYPQLGVNTEGLAIVATPDTIEKNADLVRRFIRATQLSFEAALKDPEASVEAGMKAKPDHGPRPRGPAAEGGADAASRARTGRTSRSAGCRPTTGRTRWS